MLAAGKHSHSFLFHRPAFVFRNAGSCIVPIEAQRSKIYFSRLGNSLISLDRAPFGSFLLEPGATKSEIILLLEKVECWAKDNQITTLTIRSYPDIYAPDKTDLIKNTLLESGFIIKYSDITQFLPIAIERGMNLDTHKKRRLRKAQRLAFSFRQVSTDLLAESYSLIVESRKNKSYPVTMTLQEVEDMFKLFPEDHLLFSAFDKTKMIATAVCIRVNSQILYSFYIGDLLEYRAYSPVTFLISEIYKFCVSHHINTLDLGLSTDKGVLNKTLYTFKKSFGCSDSQKLTFEKQL